MKQYTRANLRRYSLTDAHTHTHIHVSIRASRARRTSDRATSDGRLPHGASCGCPSVVACPVAPGCAPQRPVCAATLGGAGALGGGRFSATGGAPGSVGEAGMVGGVTPGGMLRVPAGSSPVGRPQTTTHKTSRGVKMARQGMLRLDKLSREGPLEKPIHPLNASSRPEFKSGSMRGRRCVCVRVGACARKRACMCACARVRECMRGVCVHVSLRLCVRACVRTCMGACVRTCVSSCMRACLRVRMRTCLHACLHLCARASPALMRLWRWRRRRRAPAAVGRRTRAGASCARRRAAAHHWPPGAKPASASLRPGSCPVAVWADEEQI